MGDVIIEGCPLCKGNGKPYQQTHTQCFDGSLLISTGCSKCGLNILGKGDDSRQKWNSIDRPKHLEQRLAEVEADFDALKSIEGKLMDMEREWRDKDVGDNPKTIARAQGVADGLYHAAKLFKTNEV